MLALGRCRPAYGLHTRIPPELERVHTPLNVEAWTVALANHPDRRFADYVTSGVTDGFRIGFNRTCILTPALRNLPSASEQEAVLDRIFEQELSLGRFMGPFDACEQWQINRVGIIPKGHTPGKWRLITDLSHPPGASVNDGIDPDLCSLSYVTVDEVVRTAAKLGRGAMLAKVDIQSAYRLIPIHPDDRPLLAMQWKGKVIVDVMLPFGLRSAPKIFTAVADGLEWITRQRGVQRIEHYLDNFIVLGPPVQPTCQRDLDILMSTCAELKVPLAEGKREGPSTKLTFLGIEVDTDTGHLRLPTEKLDRLKGILREWRDRKVCTRRELESLIGSLNHACKVVRPGRSFLRRMLDLLNRSSASTAPRPHHHIRLNREFRSDLQWWREFIVDWNGISFWKDGDRPTTEVTSDASGRWGCGAWSRNSWFQLQWPDKNLDIPIAVKELIPIVLAGALWGKEWKRQRVRCSCDNEAVVAVMRTRTSRNPHLMHLLRCLFFIEAKYDFEFSCVHIPGKYNELADDLSRNRVCAFLSKVPGADRHPSPVPRPLLDWLLDKDMDWLCPNWIAKFNSSVRKA